MFVSEIQVYWDADASKNKDTVLSQTLEIGEKKVSLFFCLVALFPRYGHFVEKHIPGTNHKMAITRFKNCILQK